MSTTETVNPQTNITETAFPTDIDGEEPISPEDEIRLIKLKRAYQRAAEMRRTPIWPPLSFLDGRPKTPQEQYNELRAQGKFYRALRDLLLPDTMTIALESGLWKIIPALVVTWVPRSTKPEEVAINEALVDRYRKNYLTGHADRARAVLGRLPGDIKEHLNAYLRMKHVDKAKQALASSRQH